MNKILSEIFKNKKVVLSALPAYGFSESGENFVYRAEILEGQMRLNVEIDKKGNIATKVSDGETDDEYTLFLVEDAVGGFVGSVREEYKKVMRDIAEKCCRTEVFAGSQTKLLVEYVREKYGDELEFLWEKYDDSAIWRRKDNYKWYALICKISKRKLGLPSDETCETLGFRMLPENSEKTVDNKRYFKGYHMNKKHWVTVCLDNSLPFDEICRLIDDSYALAIK